MNTVQNEISRLGFSQGQLMNSLVVSEEPVSQHEKAMQEFKQDADWLFKNAGNMLTAG